MYSRMFRENIPTPAMKANGRAALGKRAFFHGRRKGGHQNFDRHGFPPRLQKNVGVELGNIRLRIGLGEIGAVRDNVTHILVDRLELVF